MRLTLAQPIEKFRARVEVATKLTVIRERNRSRTGGESSKRKSQGSQGSQGARTSCAPLPDRFDRITVGRDLLGRLLAGLRLWDEHFRVR